MQDDDMDWVTERSKCSITAVFEMVKLGAENDTKTRHNLPGAKCGYEFIGGGRGSFSVSVVCTGDVHHVVKFSLDRNAIVVSADDTPFLEARVGLSDEGLCKLTVKGEELELWQFRKRALDSLFFDWE
jgi:hypothetical protein